MESERTDFNFKIANQQSKTKSIHKILRKQKQTQLQILVCISKTPLLHHLGFGPGATWDKQMKVLGSSRHAVSHAKLSRKCVIQFLSVCSTLSAMFVVGGGSRLSPTFLGRIPSIQPSLGGSYTGIEPMGLLWSMKPSPGQRRGIRLLKRDVTTPYTVTVEAFEGHLCLEGKKREVGVALLASETFEKWYMRNGVKRIPVREGRIRGTLFLPPGDGPFPGK